MGRPLGWRKPHTKKSKTYRLSADEEMYISALLLRMRNKGDKLLKSIHLPNASNFEFISSKEHKCSLPDFLYSPKPVKVINGIPTFEIYKVINETSKSYIVNYQGFLELKVNKKTLKAINPKSGADIWFYDNYLSAFLGYIGDESWHEYWLDGLDYWAQRQILEFSLEHGSAKTIEYLYWLNFHGYIKNLIPDY